MEEAIKKYHVFRSPQDGQIYVTRNIPPEFTAMYTADGLIFDDAATEIDAAWLVRRMRGIEVVVSKFLKQEEYERRKTNR